MPGFVEHWNAGTTSGWTSSDNLSNPGTGGVGGAGDGYLLLSTPGPSLILNLGANNAGAAYTGNWIAAGITRVQFWLNDVGPPKPLEIHFGLGTLDNFWQCDTGFIPPAGSWGQFAVGLTGGPTGWTQIISSTVPPGTFGEALQNVAKVLIRHDLAPYSQIPDTVTASLGVDELSLVAGSAGVPLAPSQAPRAITLAPPYPNPSRSDVTLSFESFDASPVRVEIVDAAGRLIRRDELDPASGGRHRWVWNGRAESGARAAAGSDRARVYSASGGASRSFVWLGGGR